jgi:hypothetical protein
MALFEKTPNGIVQHGPCPQCGEWNCFHDDSKYIPTPKQKESLARLMAVLEEQRDRKAKRTTHLVPGWPFRHDSKSR